MRARVCDGLEFLGISLDAEANAAARGVNADIAAAGARVRVLVIGTDEERVIADETVAVANRSPPVATAPAGPDRAAEASRTPEWAMLLSS